MREHRRIAVAVAALVVGVALCGALVAFLVASQWPEPACYFWANDIRTCHTVPDMSR